LIEIARNEIESGDQILRLRADKAGPQLAEALRALDAEVDDTIIYDNERIEYDEQPDFDAVFFASASGVESFIDQWGTEALAGKTLAVIGKPTAQALEKQNLTPDVIAREATIPGAIQSLAEYFVARTMRKS